LILALGGAPLPRLHVKLHQCPVDGLLEWIEGEKALGGLDGRLCRACRVLVCEQPPKASDGQLVQPLALGEEPIVERWLLYREPLEEVAVVEGKTLGQCRWGRLRDPLYELVDVHAHSGGIQGDGVRVHLERLGIGAPQALPDRVERLAKTRSRRRLDGASPEEARQFVPGVGDAERYRQVGQEGLRLSRGQGEWRLGAQAGPKPTEKGQCESRQCVTGSPVDPGPVRAAGPGSSDGGLVEDSWKR
jgi:hypothetical protein